MLQALVLAAAAVAPIPPAPTHWVTDDAGVLSAGVREQLDGKLAAYEHATGHQVIVWIGKTIGDTPLDDWAVRTFAAWKIGRQGIDDGVAMFVLADDRKLDIEVGYGLEDKVPDAIASRIIRDVMTPKLRANDRDGAVTAGVDAILASIEGHPWTGAPATATSPPRVPGSPWAWLLGALAVIGFVVFAITHPRLAMFMLWTFMANGRGGGFGGGDGGGGGFGGGGGRSGGGGARGGW